MAALLPAGGRLLGGFWAPLPRALRERLRGVRCVLTEGGELVRPCDAVFRPRATCPPSLLSNDELRQLTATAAAVLHCAAEGAGGARVLARVAVETRCLSFVRQDGALGGD
eukprot:3328782-Prymnesium_polylepis.1